MSKVLIQPEDSNSLSVRGKTLERAKSRNRLRYTKVIKILHEKMALLND